MITPVRRFLLPAGALALLLLVPGVLFRIQATQALDQAPAPPLALVQTAVLKAGPQEYRRVFPGVLAASQIAKLGFESPGVVSEMPVEEGRRVVAGDLLATLRLERFDAGVAQADAELALAERALADAQALQDGRSLSRERLDTARERAHQARAARQTAQAARRGAELRAPFSGVLAKRLVERGDSLAPGDAALVLFALSPLEFRMSVPENLLPLLEAARPGEETAPPEPILLRLRAHPGRSFEAWMRYRPDLPDPEHRVFIVEAQTDNEDESLRPGMVGVGEALIERLSSGVALPPEAVCWDRMPDRPGIAPPYALFVEAESGAGTGRVTAEALADLRRHGPRLVSPGATLAGRRVVLRKEPGVLDGDRVRFADLSRPNSDDAPAATAP